MAKKNTTEKNTTEKNMTAKKAADTDANLGFESRLWVAADAQRESH